MTRTHSRRTPPRSTRSIVLWTVLAVVLVLIASVAWIAIRGLMAKSELEASVALASTIQKQIVAGDTTGGNNTFVRLSKRLNSARELTSDPIWRAGEIIPGIGPNLAAMRELAAVADDVSQKAIGPLTRLAESIKLSGFKPVNGSIDLAPLVKAQPQIASATAALIAAKQQADEIEILGTFSPVQKAVSLFSTKLDKASAGVSAINRAVQLAPAMLGASGPRNYILLFQNSAELRATGGIPGAIALIHTENGKITLTQQASSNSFPHYPEPVLKLPLDTRALYGDITGEYIQDVSLTPDFTQSATLAREMWRRQFGVQADGVLSIDPVALGYMLKATGPITLQSGDVMTSDNAVKLLLTDVYARYTNHDDKNAFFAAAAGSVFSAVASGKADPVKLIEVLAQAGSEHRVLVWNADKREQSILAGTTLAGGLPLTDSKTQRFGVYLNDGTGSKMDTYLDVKLGVAQVTCRKDRRPSYGVMVKLTNTAPRDAATSLPAYVTGGGDFGVPPGNVKTVVMVYGVRGMENLGVVRDDAVVGSHPTTDSGYPVSGITVELAPGQTSTLHFAWLGKKPFTGVSVTQATPAINLHDTQQVDFSCESPLL